MRRSILLLILLFSMPSVPLTAQTGASDPGSATLLPGDDLDIQIWREPDLSGMFLVDPEGFVTLPLLGRVHVADLPLRELRDELVGRYAVELRNPSISITPRRRVYVLGEVTRPGLLALDPTMTLAGAVALAGGANREGDLSKLRIMRDGQVLMDSAGPEADLLSVDIRSGDQIFVDRRGWFDRNSTFIVSATIGIAGIIVQLLR